MTPAAASQQVLRFAAGGERLAMPAAGVAEVVPAPRTTRVPHAPASLRGLANVRGAVVPVVSLADLLGQPAGPERRLVMLAGGAPVGLLVDDVSSLAAEVRDERVVEPRPLLERAFATLGRRAAKAPAAAEPLDAAGDETAATIALLAFEVAGQEFGLTLREVREVLRLPEGIALLPHADAAVVGTAAHRGMLVPLLDLRALLGLGSGARRDAPRVLLTRIGRHRVGLVVDAVREVLHAREDQIDPLPLVLTRGAAEARIQAICRVDDGRRLVSLLSTERLFSDDVTARFAQEGQDDMNAGRTAEAEEEQILLFRLGDDEFGLPIGAVSEVTRRPERLTSLPKAPAFVDGIMNLRGQVLPVIDQRRRFGVPAEESARKPVIVVRIGASQAGFVVDSVLRVAGVPASALQPAPDLGRDQNPTIDRVASLEVDGRIVLLVNPQELLDRAERDLLAALQGGSDSQPAS